ncbi:MAG: site-specific integrase, partial [Chloroflexi bacterium]|nr:site-specific integrase [Chloroflexota bacterium]
MATTATFGERTNEPAHAPLLADYRRHLETGRGLSPATVRNYLADLAPFIQYLDVQGIALGKNANGLRAFVMQDGESNVGGEYRRLIRDYVSWLIEDRPLKSGRRAGGKGHERASVVRTLVALRSFARFLGAHPRCRTSNLHPFAKILIVSGRRIAGVLLIKPLRGSLENDLVGLR